MQALEEGMGTEEWGERSGEKGVGREEWGGRNGDITAGLQQCLLQMPSNPRDGQQKYAQTCS